jgi:hypothetical protein
VVFAEVASTAVRISSATAAGCESALRGAALYTLSLRCKDGVLVPGAASKIAPLVGREAEVERLTGSVGGLEPAQAMRLLDASARHLAGSE